MSKLGCIKAYIPNKHRTLDSNLKTVPSSFKNMLNKIVPISKLEVTEILLAVAREKPTRGRSTFIDDF